MWCLNNIQKFLCANTKNTCKIEKNMFYVLKIYINFCTLSPYQLYFNKGMFDKRFQITLFLNFVKIYMSEKIYKNTCSV